MLTLQDRKNINVSWLLLNSVSPKGILIYQIYNHYFLHYFISHQWIPNEYVHPAWLKNDGVREKTAAECLALLQEKVLENFHFWRHDSVSNLWRILQ